MKLSDFSLLDESGQDELDGLLAGFNQTARPYPRDKTVHAVFCEQVAATPDATAVVFEHESLTYQQLDERSNRFAHFLLGTGFVQHETFIGLMSGRSLEAIVSILGILKAGGAYVPINPDLPYERIKLMLNDTRAPILIGEKTAIRSLNNLQWECPYLSVIVCADCDDIYAEVEADTEMMDLDMWKYIADTAVDDITGGGWKSSYTGDWLSREVMDGYGENIYAKLAPLITPQSRILEIGSASGISMFRLAPLAGSYLGTDLSAGIVEWAQQQAIERGLDNVAVHCAAAHELDQIDEGDFDIAIINSVIECFPGHNYLRQVLRQTIDKIGDQGQLFLGNVWDQDLKEDFVTSLKEFKQANPGAHTKVDRTGELYISRHFLEDLRCDFPEIVEISYSPMLGTAESELSLFGFDALVRIDKSLKKAGSVQRHKWQHGRNTWAGEKSTAVAQQTSATGLAYLIYTSGSTGRPKGVMVEHRPILRLVKNSGFIKLDEHIRILQTGSLGFDASTFEIWGALLNGGQLCLASKTAVLDVNRLGQLIQEHAITTMWITASFFNQLVDSDLTLFQGLETLLIGGEKLSTQHINTVRQAYPRLQLINGYGPTENTTFSTTYSIETTFSDDIPIGRPIANTTAHILDNQLAPVPIGTPGELYVGGDGLARGYWGDESLTAERFITKDIRLYKTGDLARWKPDGVVEFLGRGDNQVKLRGYRIELEEIAARLLQHMMVREALVLMQEQRADKLLVAYITADAPISDGELRAHLKATLPDYMVPAYFVTLERMPLNQSGKVDRLALPKPFALENEHDAPQSDVEKTLVAIWQEVLNRPHIGVQDDFFDIGGHSLKVTKMIALIEQQLGIIVPLTAIFNHSTVRQQASYLLDCAKFGHTLADDPMVLLTSAPISREIREIEHRPLFAFPPGTGDVLGFMQVAEALNPYPFYAFNFIEAESRVQTYADLILDVDPIGPYQLFGYSSGGNLAYYVAQELEARGRQVDKVIMVDSGRRLAPFIVSEADVDMAIKGFLHHESVQPYLNSKLLMEKQARLIRRSFAWMSGAIDRHTIKADVHILLTPEGDDKFYAEDGSLISSVLAWAEVVTGTFNTYQGYGGHNDMLYSPYLAENVRILRQILKKM